MATPSGFVGMYDFKETLGEGHFSVVKLAEHVIAKHLVAVKVIDKTKLEKTELEHLHHEVRLMKLIHHPHVVRLYQVVDTATKLYLILELGDGGDLYEHLQRHAPLPESRARDIFRQITEAMNYCHRHRIAHRDLKPENVVFCTSPDTQKEMVKLTDFGLSNNYREGEMMKTMCGSMVYSAPEVLLQEPYHGPAADVWSLGILLYMIMTGHLPFCESNDSATLCKIMDVKYEVPAGISPACADLLCALIVRAPEDRPTTEDILNHPWLLGAASLRRASEQSVSFCEPSTIKESIRKLSPEDHDQVLRIMEKNGVARKDVAAALEGNTYDYVSSTYNLLLEKQCKLRNHKKLAVAHSMPASPAVSPLISPESTPAQSPRSRVKNAVKRCSEAELDVGRNAHTQTGKHTGSLRLRPRPLTSMPNNASLKNDVETDLASLALSPRMNPQVKKVRPKFPFDRSWLSHEEAEDEGCTRHGDIGSPLSASAVAHQTFPTPLSPCMWPCDSPKADLGDIHGLGFQELHTSKSTTNFGNLLVNSSSEDTETDMPSPSLRRSISSGDHLRSPQRFDRPCFTFAGSPDTTPMACRSSSSRMIPSPELPTPRWEYPGEEEEDHEQEEEEEEEGGCESCQASCDLELREERPRSFSSPDPFQLLHTSAVCGPTFDGSGSSGP